MKTTNIRWRAIGLVGLMALTAGGAAGAATHHRAGAPATAPPPNGLHARALAALPGARKALDGTLVDYPSARFQEVHARVVRSVYDDDEGHSDKVPWTHRGGLVVVLCGQINSKNHMGGYTGWKSFAYEPAQTDIVTMYGYETPTRIAHQVNIAERGELTIEHDEVVDDEKVRLLCGDDPTETDPADLSAGLTASAAKEASR